MWFLQNKFLRINKNNNMSKVYNFGAGPAKLPEEVSMHMNENHNN